MRRLVVCESSVSRLADDVRQGRLAVLPPLRGRRLRQTVRRSRLVLRPRVYAARAHTFDELTSRPRALAGLALRLSWSPDDSA